MFWLERLLPKEHASSLLAIDFPRLAEEGLQYLILDVDNTLCARGSSEVDYETVQFLLLMRACGHLRDIAIVSNVVLPMTRYIERVERLAKQADINHVICAKWPSVKPSSRPFRRAMKLMGSSAGDTIVVGDQTFSDIEGGNRLGLYTIKVPPLGPDHPLTSPKRILERMLRRTTKGLVK